MSIISRYNNVSLQQGAAAEFYVCLFFSFFFFLGGVCLCPLLISLCFTCVYCFFLQLFVCLFSAIGSIFVLLLSAFDRHFSAFVHHSSNCVHRFSALSAICPYLCCFCPPFVRCVSAVFLLFVQFFPTFICHFYTFLSKF